MENNIMDVVACATFGNNGTFVKTSLPIRITVSFDDENAFISSKALNRDLEMPAAEAKDLLAETMKETNMLILTKTAVQIDTTGKNIDEIKTMLEHELETYDKWCKMMSDASKESFDKETSTSIELELHGSEYGADARFAVAKYVHGELADGELYDTVEGAVAQAQEWIDEANNKWATQWAVLEDEKFRLQISPDDISAAMDENANRIFVRRIGEECEERFEILRTVENNNPYYTQELCDVIHCKDFDVAKACDVAESLDRGKAEELNAMPLAERINELVKMAVIDCVDHERSKAGGEFYPHEIPAYLKNLSSAAPLSPTDYQANKTTEEQQKDYCIAEAKSLEKMKNLKKERNSPALD